MFVIYSKHLTKMGTCSFIFVVTFLLFMSCEGFKTKLGAAKFVNQETDEVQKWASFAVDELNKGRNDLYISKIVEVRQAQRQMVMGMMYHLNVTISQTLCTKNHKGKVNLDKCPINPHAKKERCTFNVWVSLKRATLQPYTCIRESAQVDESYPLFQEFEDFRVKHNRPYKSNSEEYVQRYYQFCDNMERVAVYNANEQDHATYGASPFADLHPKEFLKTHTGLRQPDTPSKISKAHENPSGPTPPSFDWRTKGAVTPVKNQEQCGSCWAFSTTGNIEGQWQIKKGKLLSLSEQQLVDCDKVDHGCEGGLPSDAYTAIIKMGGLETEGEYPYEAADDKCSLVKSDIRVFINSSVSVTSDETKMTTWLANNGPISIGINAAMMQFYMGGVANPFKIFCNPDSLDHGVLIVGYGTKPGILWGENPYWIVKNSWGASWGVKGYYLVYRGTGVCGLNTMCTSSVID